MEPAFLALGIHGRYAPQNAAEALLSRYEVLTEQKADPDSAIAIVLSGPDHEHYDEAWDELCDAVSEMTDHEWHIYTDPHWGDICLMPVYPHPEDLPDSDDLEDEPLVKAEWFATARGLYQNLMHGPGAPDAVAWVDDNFEIVRAGLEAYCDEHVVPLLPQYVATSDNPCEELDRDTYARTIAIQQHMVLTTLEHNGVL